MPMNTRVARVVYTNRFHLHVNPAATIGAQVAPSCGGNVSGPII